MTIRRKSNERFKAETSAYIAESPASWAHTEVLKKDLAGTALKLTTGETITTERKSAVSDRIEKREHTSESYVAFLRSLTPEQRQDIAFMTDKMQSYESIHPSVEAMLNDASSDSSNYLGSGSNGVAFKVTIDDVDYAVKKGGIGQYEMRAFRLGENIDGISHLTAIDIDNSVGVMNYVPGRMPEHMSSEEMEAVPGEHIRAAIDKSIEMYDAGLAIDPKVSNFLYDQQHGFGMIDYHTIDKSMDRWGKSDQVFSLLSMLYTHDADSSWPHSIQMANKFLDVLEQGYPEIIEQAVEANEKVKNDPRIGRTTGPLILDIYELPEGKLFDEYKARILRLGLDGELPREVELNFEYEDDIPVVIK